MAKRGQMSSQRYADRYRGRLSFGADASTPVFETFNTGMNIGRSTAMAWVLVGATIGPAHDEDAIYPAPLTAGFEAQIALGAQAAILDPDDMQVVTGLTALATITTSGATHVQWPYVFPVLQPIPMFAAQLTVGIQGQNNAALNSKEFCYELVYYPTKVTDKEILEYLAAFGQV